MLGRGKFLDKLKDVLYNTPELEEVCDGDNIVAPAEKSPELLHDIGIIIHKVIQSVIVIK